MDSSSTGVSYVTSTSVPPLKSKPKVSPLKLNEKTDNIKIAIDVIPAIFLYFMNWNLVFIIFLIP